jgi:hypothetical protein
VGFDAFGQSVALMKTLIPAVVFAAVVVALAGCGTSSSGGGGTFVAVDGAGGDTGATDVSFAGTDPDAAAKDMGSSGGSVCAAGATQLCFCSATAKGVQVCAADSTAWGACKCEGTADDATNNQADSSVFEPPDAGSADSDTGTDQPDSDTPLVDDCPDRAKQVYVVASDTTLLRFFPDTLKLVTVGKLKCPQAGGGEPFAMSIDRNADAWVLYTKGLFAGGGLFKVSTKDASCQATAYKTGQAGFELFGMGFSADSPGSKAETLFIAGGSALTWQFSAGKLGTIGMPGLGVTHKATINVGNGAPELTGDGTGGLWGFFPQTNPPSVRAIDKKTGKTGQSWSIPAGTMSNVHAWTFARWGGSFYIFFKSQTDIDSSVFRIDSAGAVKKIMPKTGYAIVGAGVSSCAPTSVVSAP